MNALRRHLHLLSWIALMAIAALALSPTVSHALAHAQGRAGGYAEICTTQGAWRVTVVDAGAVASASAGAANDDDAPGPYSGGLHLQHCPLCSLSADAPPLPVTPAALLLPVASAATPALYLHAPYTLHAWRSAQPRGPPDCS